MSQTEIQWTTADLELFPDTDIRYETISGELFVTRAPHWQHQRVADNICMALKAWSQQAVVSFPQVIRPLS